MWECGAVLSFFLAFRITRELIEGDVRTVDGGILQGVARLRTPGLTTTALDVTALGSITLVVLFCAFALVVLLGVRDRMGAVQLVAASVGAGILTFATKNLLERTRPTEIQQLIAVTGFSYPSGHSLSTSALYLTIAIIASRHVRGNGGRAAIFVAVAGVLIAVGFSRVYLGVHYASDVAGGMLMGAGWAFALAGVFTYLSQRGSVGGDALRRSS
jgi:undecaprenyl-diphosphatase